jgi:hypothetical protein
VTPPAEVVATSRTGMTLRSSTPATVTLTLRWSRWLTVRGPACVERDGTLTRVRFSGPGDVVLTSRVLPLPRGHC